jgi:hypothetical protein
VPAGMLPLRFGRDVLGLLASMAPLGQGQIDLLGSCPHARPEPARLFADHSQPLPFVQPQVSCLIPLLMAGLSNGRPYNKSLRLTNNVALGSTIGVNHRVTK